MEEANELLEAKTAEEVNWETADLLYFTMVAMTAQGGSFEDVMQTLYRRTQLVTRRPGNAKTKGGST